MNSQEDFSGALGDKEISDNKGIPAFLITPSRAIKEYLPDPNKEQNGKVIIIRPAPKSKIEKKLEFDIGAEDDFSDGDIYE